jgi:hypothetical protein
MRVSHSGCACKCVTFFFPQNLDTLFISMKLSMDALPLKAINTS